MPGAENVVADTLSRPAAAIVQPTDSCVSLQELAHGQEVCGDTAEMRGSGTLNVHQLEVEVQLYCELSQGSLRPLVPKPQS